MDIRHYLARRAGRHPERAGITQTELLVGLAIVALLAALLVPAISKVRTTAGHVREANNLHQLNLAVQGYTDRFNRLPPSYNGRATAEGGWAPAILESVEQEALLAQFDATQPIHAKVNCEVGARYRPSILSGLNDVPYPMRPSDAVDEIVPVLSTTYTFNGVIAGRSALELRERSQTPFFLRLSDGNPWILSPEFFAVGPTPPGETQAIAFADGSVQQRKFHRELILDDDGQLPQLD